MIVEDQTTKFLDEVRMNQLLNNQSIFSSGTNESFTKRIIRKGKATMTGIEVEKMKINLNTIIAVVGFMGTFGALVTTWSDTRNDLEDTSKWIAQHEGVHTGISKDLLLLHDDLTAKAALIIDLNFRVAQNTKAIEALDTRISRVTESYGNQFTDIRSALSAITTNQALANQALQQILTAGKFNTPQGLK